MGSTNKTTNLNLSQFDEDDKPTWLGDYNGDMRKIDAKMGGVDTAVAEAKASATAAQTAAAGAASAAQGAVNSGLASAKVEWQRDDTAVLSTVRQEAAAEKADTLDQARIIAQQVVAGTAVNPILDRLTAALTTPNTQYRIAVLGSADAVTDRWPDRMAHRSGATAGVEALATAATIGGGIRWFYGAGSGETAAQYLPQAVADRIGALSIDLIIHMVGRADYGTNIVPATFEQQMRDNLARAEAANPAVKHVLVLHPQRRDVTGTYPLSQYEDALNRIAQEKPDARIFIDANALTAARRNWGLYTSDNLTLGRQGNYIVANALCHALGIPTEEGFAQVPLPSGGSSASVNGTLTNAGGSASQAGVLFKSNAGVAPFPRNVNATATFSINEVGTGGCFLVLRLRKATADVGSAARDSDDIQQIIRYAVPAMTAGNGQTFQVDGEFLLPADVNGSIVAQVLGKSASPVQVTIGQNDYNIVTVSATPA